MNKYPKFAVGEDIVLQSKCFPEVNGFEATVSTREWDQFWGEYAYKICPDPLGEVQGYTDKWAEESLHKRPSDMSYKELITSLKSKEPVT